METNYNSRNITQMHDEEAERSLLGALMQYEGLYLKVRDSISPDMFYNQFHRDLYTTIKEIGNRGEHPDFVMVSAELQKKMANAPLYELSNILMKGYSVNVQSYIDVLHNLAIRRNLWALSTQMANDALSPDKSLESLLERYKDGVADTIIPRTANILHTLHDVLAEVQCTIEANQSDSARNKGANTGFSKLDEKGGWQPSNLIIVAADSSQGKSSFAMNTAVSAMESGSKVVFYSMEMTRQQLVSRILSSRTGIPSNVILWDKLMQDEAQRVWSAIHDLDTRIGQRLFFDDASTSSLEQIMTSIRIQKAKHNIDGAVVDYLQILNVNDKSNQSTARKLGDAARLLKNLAKELNIWIIALSQLSRDRDNPAPSIARVRDSGEITEAADILILIYRPEVYGKRYPEPFENKQTKGTAMIDVAKGRNIGLLKFLVGFDSQRTIFYEPTAPIPDALDSVMKPTDETPDF